MARPGDSIDNGKLKLTFRETSASTGGQRLLMEALYRPHSPLAPLHFHPQDARQLGLDFRLLGKDESVSAGVAPDRFRPQLGAEPALRPAAVAAGGKPDGQDEVEYDFLDEAAKDQCSNSCDLRRSLPLRGRAIKLICRPRRRTQEG